MLRFARANYVGSTFTRATFTSATLLLSAIGLLGVLGCSSAEKASTPQAPATAAANPAAENDLSLSEAQSRKARLSDVQYELKLNIAAMGEQYLGTQTVRFQLKDASQDLRLDFFQGEVTSIEINGKSQATQLKSAAWITLPKETLQAGANTVVIGYKQTYANNGQGLHRFKDKEDGQFYLHSQFESFDANRFMPCFDQPDLRATLKLEVIAPKGWQVISTTREIAKKPILLSADGQVQAMAPRYKSKSARAANPSHDRIIEKTSEAELWDFPTSAKLATYLFSLHAGPYRVYGDEVDGIPLRIFVRPTMAKYFDASRWLKYTKQCLQFYGGFFALKYPFQKLDSVIAPEFNMGGMENVGAIVYTEHMLSRGKLTRRNWRNVAGLIAHETAHLWFGDLVTMAWWNDLWLNESFATLMAGIALNGATEFSEAWQDFAAYIKAGAYKQDALSVTHPIEAKISRVKEAEAIFDGITYNKGASVMKQLRFYMGEQAFQKGIQSYMKKHSYQNTTLTDFIASLQAETKHDLSLWAERWLRQSGTDTVETAWKCNTQGQLNQITVTGKAATGTAFKPQALLLGLYRGGAKPGDSLKQQTTIRVELENEEPVVVQGPWPCPEFVYANVGDQGYVNVALDAKSIEFLKKNLAALGDDLLRTLVWNDLWRMVRDEQISLRTYIEVVDNNFAQEKNEIVLSQILGRVVPGRGDNVLDYWPVATAEQRRERAAFVAKLEKDFMTRMRSYASGSDEEKFWYDHFTRVCESKEGLDQLVAWFKAGMISAKFPLDLDRQWQITWLLSRYNHPAASAILAEISKKDTSDRGRKSALSAQSVTPILAVKEKWVSDMLQPQVKTSVDELASVAYGLFPREQSELRKKFEPQFFDFLEKNKASDDEYRVQAVLYGLVPLSCESSGSQKVKARLQKGDDLNPLIRKSLQQSVEEDERCQRIRGGF